MVGVEFKNTKAIHLIQVVAIENQNEATGYTNHMIVVFNAFNAVGGENVLII